MCLGQTIIELSISCFEIRTIICWMRNSKKSSFELKVTLKLESLPGISGQVKEVETGAQNKTAYSP